MLERAKQLRITAAGIQVSTIRTALDAFQIDTGGYPRGQDGLVQLLAQPSNVSGWRGPYLKDDVPLDPWGEPYQYLAPGTHNKSGYDLWSKGPDKQSGTADDIGSWNLRETR